MVKRHSRGLKGWVRVHLYSIICIILAAMITAGSLTWYALATDTYVKNTNAQTQQTRDEAVKLAEETKKKLAEQAAQEKARQEQAAKEAAQKAAEQAKTGSNTATDSKACNVSTSHNNPVSVDVVVNKKNCMQPLGYVPGDLVTSHGATLSAKAMGAFNQMYDAAATAGQPFYVTSSFRSYNTQITTYNRWVSISGAAGADTYSARAGYSEHQTGFVVDVAANGCTLDCFGGTSQYQWFQQNAANYGFIQRYYAGYESITGYKAEEWHYRYVGVDVAKDMQAKGVKTLEQYWNIPGGDY